MKQISLPSYSEVSLLLNKTTRKLDAAQVHGLVCGLLCGTQSAPATWTDLVTGAKSSKQANKVLQTLYQASESLLAEFLFEFQLLVPEDDETLLVRAEALSLWAQGFLTGLKMVQVPIVAREPSEVTEAINDIIEIAKMDHEDIEADEEDEAAYTELLEYMRMAVIFIYQDLHRVATDSANATDSTHHLH